MSKDGISPTDWGRYSFMARQAALRERTAPGRSSFSGSSQREKPDAGRSARSHTSADVVDQRLYINWVSPHLRTLRTAYEQDKTVKVTVAECATKKRTSVIMGWRCRIGDGRDAVMCFLPQAKIPRGVTVQLGTVIDAWVVTCNTDSPGRPNIRLSLIGPEKT